MIHNTPGKCFTKAFMQMVTLWDFTHRLKHYSHRTQHNDKYHKKVLLGSFHLKGHTPGFQSKNILWSIIISTVPQESAVQLWVSIEKISSTDFRLNDAIFFFWQWQNFLQILWEWWHSKSQGLNRAGKVMIHLLQWLDFKFTVSSCLL